MKSLLLEHIIEQRAYAGLPLDWKVADLERFSEGKTLYDYQVKALERAILGLHLYFENYQDVVGSNFANELPALTAEKAMLMEMYRAEGLTDKIKGKLNIKNDFKDFDFGDFYPLMRDGQLDLAHLLNRMSFWMATGSGKSLVIVKLMTIVIELMKRGHLPQRSILFMTHKENLIDQLKEHIAEFNKMLLYHEGYEIVLRELKDWLPMQQSKSSAVMFEGRYLNIFYYRSDLIDTKEKDNYVDFRNYQNDGSWYIFLDEAHRGKKEDSKRQQYYSVMSRNGFIFNFSATFTDTLDHLTTVYNFNLSQFITKGYGKHLYILQDEIDSFKNHRNAENIPEYTEAEKQLIVLKSLILLTYVKHNYKNVSTIIHEQEGQKAYHNPLLLTLVNSVNKKDSDLALFFRELEKIAMGRISITAFEQAKKELYGSFKENPTLVFEPNLDIDITPDFLAITFEEVLQAVFNTQNKGGLEAKRNPNNHQELAFSVKASDNPEPFALIKIGDTDKWIKSVLEFYDIDESYKNESVFENLNDNSVNILMGSRAFYEGWDSNRPNVICFINIGTSTDAKKFIQQSVGRGIRIEPVKNERQRLPYLVKNGNLTETWQPYANLTQPVETLYIFGTKRDAVQTIMNTMHEETYTEEYRLDNLTETPKALIRLVPKYILSGELSAAKIKKLWIHKQDLTLIQDLLNDMSPIAFILNFNISAVDYNLLQSKFAKVEDYFLVEENTKRLGYATLLLAKILNYFKIEDEHFGAFQDLDKEISHYKNIKVRLPYVRFKELKDKVETVKNFETNENQLTNLAEQLATGQIDVSTFMEQQKTVQNLKAEDVFYKDDQTLFIQKLANHFYVPSLISQSNKLEWINHIIETPSEVEFLKDLATHLGQKNNFFQTFDKWQFSRIDHTIDSEIRIPYIDPQNGQKRNFLPDFIFWLQKGKDYHLLFIDPKGTGRQEYQYKIEGYKTLFENEDGSLKMRNYNGLNVFVHLKFYTKDSNIITDNLNYKKYWLDKNNFYNLFL